MTITAQSLLQEVAQYAIDGLSLGALYALFALGIALIFGVMGLINFAHGEIMMAGAYTLVVGATMAIVPLAAIALGVCVGVALLLERIGFRPVRGADPETMLVTSFALSFFLQSLAEVIFGGTHRSVDILPALNTTFEIQGVLISKLSLVIIVVATLLLTALVLFLNRTELGVHMRAAAEDFHTAQLLGVRANRVIASAFALSGLLAGVAVILVVTQQGAVDPRIGTSVVLLAFVATVIGGMGSLLGAVVGGMLLGILTVLLDGLLPQDLAPFRDAFVFGTVFLVLVLRPQGLIPSRAHGERV